MLFARSRLFASPKTQPETEDDHSRLYLVRANDKTGHRAFYFMLIDKERIQSLKETIAKKLPFNLAHFGEIVSSGYGDSVPEGLRIRMRVEYGWAS